MDTNLNTVSLADFTNLVTRNFTMTTKNFFPVTSKLFIRDDVGMNNGEFRLNQEFDKHNFAS